tara:strand:+ start:138 stop:398 length:261 start_codon:yes stop_codon:yes gene_type:complete
MSDNNGYVVAPIVKFIDDNNERVDAPVLFESNEDTPRTYIKALLKPPVPKGVIDMTDGKVYVCYNDVEVLNSLTVGTTIKVNDYQV